MTLHTSSRYSSLCQTRCIMSIPVNSPDFVGRLPISRISPDHPISTKNLLISQISSRFFELISFFEKLINFIKNNVGLLRKLIISYRQYTESCRHNQTFDYQPKTCCFGIDIRLLLLVSIARTTGMNMSVERQGIAN